MEADDQTVNHGQRGQLGLPSPALATLCDAVDALLGALGRRGGGCEARQAGHGHDQCVLRNHCRRMSRWISQWTARNWMRVLLRLGDSDISSTDGGPFKQVNGMTGLALLRLTDVTMLHTKTS